ncbi:MAG: isopentenyl-diphosphate Delta-isomerase [Calditrichaceae bacterium]|nr:isopentenyl-diphosphate Delta-isomerase [Calditrichaceae bacterium]MBN2709747.1 isopentenyl-diphosphate Delta-isomerase [Calditrichaceae bacterium]RQV94941.1 MAG: isopentenyl-diphosphate Delta-isomerase [Calditrichota bacterium]
MNNTIVSFDDEKLILVDSDDNVLGYEDKNRCHDGGGILHRAFSIFIFNSKNELLLQKRSASKRLWGNYWSNTCCSHPRKGESYETATVRRLKEEIGLSAKMIYLYKFQYQAGFGAEGSENELCSVYIGKTDRSPQINPTEIDDWKYISRDNLNKALEENPGEFTPWFKMEWKRLQEEHWDQIVNLKSD